MTVLIGMLGAMVGIALFVLGVFFGKAIYSPAQKKEAVTENLSEEELVAIQEERKRLIEEQRAFRELVNYNAEMAYGRADPEKG